MYCGGCGMHIVIVRFAKRLHQCLTPDPVNLCILSFLVQDNTPIPFNPSLLSKQKTISKKSKISHLMSKIFYLLRIFPKPKSLSILQVVHIMLIAICFAFEGNMEISRIKVSMLNIAI